ncbi:MAG TPA: ATP-dependent DNA helicase [Candidatus Paceibacterota bacterium]|nr:ATP-dependent DNA helicase [Candidatus Paceibacterota bacterium]
MKAISTTTFDQAYARLNTEQRKAVDAIEGPVVVIAGPGTGKTQILAMRIANILLKTDTPPEAVLAIAFSESAVSSMRKRLLGIMGETAYKVSITTFHAFANAIIQEFPEAFPEFGEGSAAEETERLAIVEKALDSRKDAEDLRPHAAPYAHVRKILVAISSLKRENITPATLKQIIENQVVWYDAQPDKVHDKGAHKGKIKAAFAEYVEKIERNKALLAAYEGYEAGMRAEKLYDFDDMLVSANKALETHEYIKRVIQERYLYILVDEHQDTNAAQNQLIKHVADFHEAPNIFVVGDEKQAIYRFQGASIQNFMMLPEAYRDVKIISLAKNYRSKQHILDNAHTLIGETGMHHAIPRMKLEGSENIGSHVHIAHAVTESDEMHWVRGEILKIQETNADETIAIIVRDNSTAAAYAQFLQKESIYVKSTADSSFFEHVEGKRLATLLNAVRSPEEDTYLAEVLLYGLLPIELSDALKVLTSAKKEKRSISEILQERHGKAYGKFHEAVLAGREQPLVEALGSIFTACGVYESIVRVGMQSSLDLVLRVLVKEAQKTTIRNRGAMLADFVERLERMKTNEVRISVGESIDDFTLPGVYILTAHRSKGLEFDRVFIPSATESTWARGNRGSLFHIPQAGLISKSASLADGTLSDESAETLDELRLFYVAVTRARSSVYVSYHDVDMSGREATMYRGLLRIELRVGDAVIDIPKVENLPKGRMQEGRLEQVVLAVENAFIEQGLTVTALNNYIECPWKYVFMNALRVPFIQPAHLSFGTAMHAALEHWLRKKMKGEEVGSEGAYQAFLQALRREPISLADEERFKEEGRIALSEYTLTSELDPSSVIALEYSLKDIRMNVEGRYIELCGIIDRIERMGGELAVVDYKTGKHRSRNYVLGNTADSTGSMFRQLAFYKLLLSKDITHSDTPVTIGVIDFVQPDEKNRLSRVECVLTKEDVSKVEEEIRQTSQAILSGAYVGSRCGKKDCEHCSLADAIAQTTT